MSLLAMRAKVHKVTQIQQNNGAHQGDVIPAASTLEDTDFLIN